MEPREGRGLIEGEAWSWVIGDGKLLSLVEEGTAMEGFNSGE